MKRVISYIDGFNLYFGLKSKGWTRFLWLNVDLLSRNLLALDQQLIETKYFTSRVGSPPDKVKRQNTYLEAVATVPGVSMYFGHYLTNPYICRDCGARHGVHQEKMTDVNIAVELLQDAFLDAFDTAILVSADSDLIAPVLAIRRLFPSKRVIVACPPGRFSVDLSKAAHGYMKIGHGVIERSQFPDDVLTASGFVLRRPNSWR